MHTILQSKLIPPIPSTYYLRRKQLMKKLQRMHDSKCTILHSGAGYGKSSALAQFFADQQPLFSWYQVTAADDTILPFYRYLYRSIQRVLPSFTLANPQWDQLGKFPTTEQLNELAMLFVNALYDYTEPICIVLDDFHYVRHNFQINYVMDQLLQNAPAHAHFVIATRTLPNWHALRLLKRQRQLIICDEHDFIFSKEEIQIFFNDFFQFDVTEEQAARIFQMTEGWAMAIFLMALQGEDQQLPFDELTKLTVQEFFDYLSDEVFATSTPAVQQSLMRYAIFSSFSSSLIAQFYGEAEHEQLQQILTGTTFIQPLAHNESFRFHSLLQQFLEQKWKERDVQAYREENRRAALYFIEQQNVTEAFYHSQKTNDVTFIASLLVEHATHFMSLGHYDWLLEQLKLIPLAVREQQYMLYFIEGECQRYRALYDKAKHAYEMCIQFARAQRDDAVLLQATAGMANIYLDTLQPSLAEAYLLDAIALAQFVGVAEAEMVLLQRQYVENLVNLGNARAAEHVIEKEQLTEDVLALGNIDVRVKLRQGKLTEARALAVQRLAHAHPFHDTHRETWVLLSLIDAMMGEPLQAFEAGHKGLYNSQLVNAQYASAVAHIRLGHAFLQLYPHHLQLALAQYEIALASLEQLHIARIKAECLMGMALTKARLGYVEEAIQDASQGLRETEKVHDRWVSGLLFLSQTIIYFEQGDMTRSEQMADKALHHFVSCDDAYCTMVVHYWLLSIAARQGHEQMYIEHFQAFYDALPSYRFFLTKQTLFSPRYVLHHYEVLQYGLQFIEITQAVAELVSKYELEEEATYPKEPLYIELLGPLTLLRGQERLPDKVWQREKAKELFVYLYMQRHRFVSKEEMMETLWPFSDEEARQRDFKVAYNALLNVLEPRRAARTVPFYMERKQQLYRLRAQPFIESDVAQLTVLYQHFAQHDDERFRMAGYEQLIALYSGPFFQEYEQLWVAQVRDRLATMYLTMHEQLAAYYLKHEQYEQALHWAHALVELDPTWEEAYRLLMLCYSALNNRVAAIRWYEKCEQQLKHDLNIAPTDATVELYERILK